jgi:hypothetical protein
LHGKAGASAVALRAAFHREFERLYTLPFSTGLGVSEIGTFSAHCV